MRRIARIGVAFMMMAGAASAQSSVTLDDFDVEGAAPAQPRDCNEVECETVSDDAISLDNVINLGIIDREAAVVEPAATGTTADKLSRAITLESIDLDFPVDGSSETRSAGLSDAQIEAVRQALNRVGRDKARVGVVGRSGADAGAMRKARDIADELSERMELAPDEVETIELEDGGTGAAVQIVIIPIE